MARPRRPPFDSRLADFRDRAGLTQEQVAQEIGISAEMVRRHEQSISLPIAKYRERYSSLYNASEVELGLRIVVTRPPSSNQQSASSSVLLDIPSVWIPERIDATYLESVYKYIEQLIDLDNRFGGADLARLAQRFFRTFRSQLSVETFKPVKSRDLFAAAGELSEVAGWLSYDADQQDAVRRLNQESLYFTRLAGDKKTELLTLQNISMHAGFLNQPLEALTIAESVLDGEYNLSPRMRALFLARKARALAQGGDESALRIFKEVQSLYLEGVQEADPAWTWWIDERELAWHEAMCQQALGYSGEAIVQFERSVEETPPAQVRGHYNNRAYLLNAQVDLKSWTAVERTMQDLQPLVTEIASTRTVVYLRSVVGKLRMFETKVPTCIVELGEHLDRALDIAPI